MMGFVSRKLGVILVLTIINHIAAISVTNGLSTSSNIATSTPKNVQPTTTPAKDVEEQTTATTERQWTSSESILNSVGNQLTGEGQQTLEPDTQNKSAPESHNPSEGHSPLDDVSHSDKTLGKGGRLEHHISGTNYKVEKELYESLMKDYNKDIRPSTQAGTPVLVGFDMKMQQLVGYDVKKQVLTITAFNRMIWYDPQLKWDKSDYSDTKEIHVKSSNIWTPDIVLYNTALEESKSHEDMYKTRVMVNHNGLIIWVAPVTWKISCASDITWFPIDEQDCKFHFGSWSYSKSHLEVMFIKEPGEKDKDEMMSDVFLVESGEWNVISITSLEKELTFNCCDEPFSTIGYEIVLHRIALYYFMYIILPLLSLSFVFILIFHIPSDSGERMGFGVTVLLSITVYLLVISEKLPEKSDNKPMLGVCFITIFYVLCFGLAAAAFTTLLSRRKHKPPNFLLRISRNGGIMCASTSKVVTPSETIESLENVKKIPNYESKENYSEDWEKIGRYIDKRISVIFSVCLLVLPFAVLMAY